MFFRSLVVASIVSLVAAGPCVRDYTVKEGDYCDKISAAQNVSTYQLAVINNGIINDECTNLVPGEKICLGYEGEDCSAVHNVVAGNTCDAIIAMHNLNSTVFYENNRQINSECTNIYIGEVLCVASTITVPPPVEGKPYPIPSTAVPANPSKTPAPSNNSSESDDGDDDDLPWCDEL